jgi:hypothetical protein
MPAPLVILVALGLSASQQPPADVRSIATSCAEDAAHFCPDYDVHGAAVRACLAQHHVSLRLACRKALAHK